VLEGVAVEGQWVNLMLVMLAVMLVPLIRDVVVLVPVMTSCIGAFSSIHGRKKFNHHNGSVDA